MSKRLLGLFFKTLVVASLVAIAQAQEPVSIQSAAVDQDKGTQQLPVAPTVSTAYIKWRTDTLPRYAQGLLTPHYAVAIVAQRLDDSTAQVEILMAAEMKQYTVSIRPVMLNRLPSGETESTPAGNVVTIDQKAGDKLGTSSDKIRIGRMTTTVAVSRSVQALEITWKPKNENPDDPSNTCIVRLSREPEVIVNGYVVGTPIR